jgi:hypothetical protein
LLKTKYPLPDCLKPNTQCLIAQKQIPNALLLKSKYPMPDCFRRKYPKPDCLKANTQCLIALRANTQCLIALRANTQCLIAQKQIPNACDMISCRSSDREHVVCYRMPYACRSNPQTRSSAPNFSKIVYVDRAMFHVLQTVFVSVAVSLDFVTLSANTSLSQRSFSKSHVAVIAIWSSSMS